MSETKDESSSRARRGRGEAAPARLRWHRAPAAWPIARGRGNRGASADQVGNKPGGGTSRGQPRTGRGYGGGRAEGLAIPPEVTFGPHHAGHRRRSVREASQRGFVDVDANAGS